jgi:bifunctional non-homologous end joining protein LigD
MPLDTYRAKRNFAKTPEPSGAAPRASSAGAPFFCVQKHLASQLHYDFRLEHDGVLLSWAVPKGPSLDPSVKRLAMHVEDHPIEYGEFEGVIPEGYGAGIVMLWDRGTWQPEVADVGEALKKGDLKFRLDGYKLKGSWALVRTHGYDARGGRSEGGADRPSGRSWLLIKHRDEWSGELDIAEFAPLSVKSKADFAEILAADNPDIWVSSRPARGGQTGEMLRRIVEQAVALRAEAAQAAATPAASGSTATAAARESKRPAARRGTAASGSRARARTATAGGRQPRKR